MPILLPPPLMTGLLPVNRLYLANAAPSFSPTVKGPWNYGFQQKKLSRSPEGASAFFQMTESDSVAVSYLASMWTTQPLLSPLTISGTFDICVGVHEIDAAANAVTRIYLYVTQGDSNSVRGVLYDNQVGIEWPTTLQGWAHTGLSLSSVAALTGDRIVLEYGTFFTNTTTSIQDSRVYYGTTGLVDLTNGDTNVTTRPGWINFNTVKVPVGG